MVTGTLLGLGIQEFCENHELQDIWKFGIGQVTAGTVVTAVTTTKTGTSVLRVILLSNLPQLAVSIAYFLYNAQVTCMLLAAEYDDYAVERKPLRVSWPRGDQRYTYYLTLPYRYSVPLLAASAILHWLVSQSLFYMEIIPFNLERNPQSNHALVTCGYSPAATILAIALGILFIVVLLLLGRRRLRSQMPLAVHCSAAISAACHPITRHDHAAQPIQWGEVTLGAMSSTELTDIDTIELETQRSSGLSSNKALSREWRYFRHCSFTSDETRVPDGSLLYI